MLSGNVSLYAGVLQKINILMLSLLFYVDSVLNYIFLDVSEENAALNFRIEVGCECSRFMTLHT
jgi:hypothetical protein